MPIPLSLYIHIPFCAAKCAYCDFASWSGKEDAWAEYVHALEGEMAYWKGMIKPSDGKPIMEDYEIISLFIGGGTPSILPPEMIGRILRSAKEIAPFVPDAEITTEANPGTLTMEKLTACKQGGVNRLSFGAQSFDERMLKMLGRIHSAREIEEAVNMAREAGFENINLDLMYALPGQTMDIWKDTLSSAAALGAEHISAYSLILEEGTKLHDKVQRGQLILPSEDETATMYEQGIAALLLLPSLLFIKASFTLPDIALLALLGVLMTAVAHTLFISSLKGISAQTAGICSSMETVYGILLAMLVLGEIPSLRECIGAVVILSVVIYSQKTEAAAG